MCSHDDDDEYESLPNNAPPWVHAMAGSVAGVVEHTVMFPIDVVKTRMHRLRPEPGAVYRSAFNGLNVILREEGFRALFRGFSVTAIGAGPAHAMYFSFYEQSKVVFNVNEDPAGSPIGTAGAAIVATFAHEGTMNPIEVVKQRLQLFDSPYRGAWDCIKKTFSEDGIFAFYRSYSTQILMSVPFQITHLVTYEQLRERLNPSHEYSPSTHLLAGAGAGALASAVTNPFDVVKTLLNTQEPVLENQRIKGVRKAFQTVYQTNGPAGFFKGLQPRVLLATPATAVSWMVYEFFKHTLHFSESSEQVGLQSLY
eukprot:m.227404 g.227404  ORF g.227404 m.227404 type:complete len:311 (+) comp15972_c0_seq4:336-1268(+)